MSLLVLDSILAVRSTVSFISVSSLLPVPDSTAVLLPVPGSVPVPELLSVLSAELDPGSSASESYTGSLVISVYYQAYVSGKPRLLQNS